MVLRSPPATPLGPGVGPSGRAAGWFLRRPTGQAAVELVAVLPLLFALLAALWQLAVAGHAAWSAAGAAEAAARAVAVGADARAAARRRLAAPLERGLRVRTSSDGLVRVTLRVPPVVGLRVGTVSAKARFAPQR
jgi:Flp pilus assembly protein TadG